MRKLFYIVLLIIYILINDSAICKTERVDIQALLAKGLLLYPDIKRKYHELQLAYLQLQQVFYFRLPDINTTVNFGYYPLVTRPPDEFGVYRYQFDLTRWSFVFNPTMTVTIPIYTFGRISNGEKAAENNIELKKAEIEETEAAIKYEVKRIFWSYFHILYIKNFIIKDVVSEYEKTVKEKDDDFVKGKITRKSYEDYKIEYLGWKRTELDIDRSYNELLLWIKLINGATEEDNVELIDSKLRPINVEIKPYSYYYNLVKEYNYSFKKAHYGYLARYYKNKSDLGGLLPTIGFGMWFTYSYNSTSGVAYPVLPSNDFTFLFGFSISWNLSLWKTYNTYQQIKENYAADLESIKMSSTMQEMEIKRAYDSLDERKRRLFYSEEQFKAARRSVILTVNAYKSGTVNRDEYINSLITLYNRRRDYYATIFEFNMAVAYFEKVLGIEIADYNHLFKKEMGEGIEIDKKESEESNDNKRENNMEKEHEK